MSGPVLHHRTRNFEDILQKSWAGLKKIFATETSVQILAGTGSLAMEASLVNVLSEGDEVLVINGGKFGERWAEMGKRYKLHVHDLKLEWGEAIDLKELQNQIRKAPQLKAVTCQACETSSGTVFPVQEISRIVKENSKALFLVDGITAVGAMKMPMSDWGIDVLIAGSQKALMLPTGLSFISLSKAAWSANSQAKLPRYYLDLAQEKAANDKGQSFVSAPTPLILGLNAVLQKIESVGIERLYERCNALQNSTLTACAELGLKTFSKIPSPTVSALTVPTGVDTTELQVWLEENHNITIMGGQDHLKSKIIRIGHMGDIHNDDMKALIAGLAEGLNALSGRETVSTTAVQAAQTTLEKSLRNSEALFR